MNMMRWNPFPEMDDFFKSYHRALSRHQPHEGLMTTDWAPSVDITESEKEFLIKVELPEVRKEDIEVDVRDGVMTISGERKQETRDDKAHRIERFYGSFARSFTLPDSVRDGDIEAEHRDGMLYLHLPKSEPEQPKKVKVDIK
jgi:HSP20 family protein